MYQRGRGTRRGKRCFRNTAIKFILQVVPIHNNKDLFIIIKIIQTVMALLKDAGCSKR